MALREMHRDGLRGVLGRGEHPHGLPVRTRSGMEGGTMADHPLVPCALCDLVPGRPDRQDGVWQIACPICGRRARGETEEVARARWLEFNQKEKPEPSASLELLDAIESAMCDLEAVRTVPGAMTVWHRWMDDLHELRRLVEAHGEGGR